MAKSIRLYIAAPLSAGTSVALSREQAHYLGAVMRLSPGATIFLFNARDGEWRARIDALGPKGAIAVPETPSRASEAEHEAKTGGGPWLAFALLKRQATDLVVQKATELGAAALLPVLTARGVGERVNLGRLEAIAIEAAEQSERLSLPVIHAPQPLPALLATWPRERRLIAAIERADAPPPMAGEGPVALLIGPEGGFTPAELDVLRAHPFVEPATLGPRILRAETAAIAGLALLQGPLWRSR